MKNIFNKIPSSIKVLLSLNLVFYLFILLFDFFGIDLNFYLGLHNFSSTNFSLYQFVTCIFSHDVVFDHILVNVILFLLFSFGVFKIYGNKGLLITYLLGGFVSSLSFAIFMTDLYHDSIGYVNNSGLKIKNLPFEYNGQIDKFDFILTEKLSDDQNWSIDVFNSSMKYAVGSSGAVSAIMMVFLLTFIFNLKKLVQNLIVIFLILITSFHYYEGYLDLIGTTVGHLGGFIGGIICFVYLKLHKTKKEV